MASSASAARAGLVVAALLWSLGSVLMRVLQRDLGLGLHDPPLSALQIAFYRGLFGGLFMLLLVRRGQITFRPLMLGMVVAFTVMSGCYLSALGYGAAANAIFLQNTAPVWVYLFAVFVLRESGDRRGWQSVVLAAAGAVVIVAGGWPANLEPEVQREQIAVLAMGLASGIVYALVVLMLRLLREHAAVWLVALNLLGSAATLGLFVLVTRGPAGFADWVAAPSAAQFAVLVLGGILQLGVPYWLFTRSLRYVSPHEAAIITLIEPLVNPIWAYLLTPETDTPTASMFVGGGLILVALVWKYLPGLARPDRLSPARTPADGRHRDKEMA